MWLFPAIASRSFHISVFTLKPSVFLKTFLISRFRWIQRVSDLLLHSWAGRRSLESWCEATAYYWPAFPAQRSLPDLHRWDISLLSWQDLLLFCPCVRGTSMGRRSLTLPIMHFIWSLLPEDSVVLMKSWMKCEALPFAVGGTKAPGSSHQYPLEPEPWARIPSRALAGVAQWAEHGPTNQRVMIQFLVRALAWVAGQVPGWEHVGGNISFPLFLHPFPSL